MNELALLNKLTISQLAGLSNFSKAYISQVKNGKRPPSQGLLDKLQQYIVEKYPKKDHFTLFMDSRKAMGVTQGTIRFYEDKLRKYMVAVDYQKATRKTIERYLNSIPPNEHGLGNRHSHFRAIKTFHRWLEAEYDTVNPIDGMPAPILGRPILPSLTAEQVGTLIEVADNVRDKAIIGLFTDSGLRLSELAGIKRYDIDWDNRVIKVNCKGQKQAYAVFGEVTEGYLKEWLNQFESNDSIWDFNKWGIESMLRRLQEQTGLTCNPHTFRRTFACLLRKAGVDTMTIKDLGRWESLEMVQRYTRSVTFHDSLKLYKPPLS